PSSGATGPAGADPWSPKGAGRSDRGPDRLLADPLPVSRNPDGLPRATGHDSGLVVALDRDGLAVLLVLGWRPPRRGRGPTGRRRGGRPAWRWRAGSPGRGRDICRRRVHRHGGWIGIR